MLRHEELQSKETATVVMNKIMASGGPDIKVKKKKYKKKMKAELMISI